jgi:hypothetical protein
MKRFGEAEVKESGQLYTPSTLPSGKQIPVSVLGAFILCVYRGLGRADPPSNESYQLCIGLRN